VRKDEKTLVKIILFTHFCGMRITIDIEEQFLADAMRLTGESKKGPAVVKAAREFVRRQMAREFGRKLIEGEFGDYPMTNDQIEDYDR
jgi:Arc/MetJ family transcription regulator